jgi:hypothetical protein
MMITASGRLDEGVEWVFLTQERSRLEGNLDHKVLGFYEGSLATHYGLIFEDWNRAIDSQVRVLDRLLKTQFPNRPLSSLGRACDIGTEAFGFAASGHELAASDLSQATIRRAGPEANIRGMDIPWLHWICERNRSGTHKTNSIDTKRMLVIGMRACSAEASEIRAVKDRPSVLGPVVGVGPPSDLAWSVFGRWTRNAGESKPDATC